MCIIVVKPQGMPMPADEIMETCWQQNPHGAGLMYAHEDKVHIVKGLMEWKAFKKELAALGKKHDLTALPLVMHFRISTQAGVNPENTHPFAITRDVRKLTAKKSSSTVGGLVHNGIIPCCSYMDDKEKYSDTLYFVKDYVARLARKPDDLKERWIQTILDEVAQSKLSVMLPDGEIIMLGEFILEDGLYYSNDSFLPRLLSDGYHDDWAYYDDVTLYPCDENMCYFDEESGEYIECRPELDWYDADGELWYYDDCDVYEPAYYADHPVLDSYMQPIKPVKKKGRRIAHGLAS